MHNGATLKAVGFKCLSLQAGKHHTAVILTSNIVWCNDQKKWVQLVYIKTSLN